MKHFYTLLAALFVMTGAMTAQTADAQDKPTVQWDQVAVVRNALTADITVTAKISIPEGTTFSYPVYPVITR